MVAVAILGCLLLLLPILLSHVFAAAPSLMTASLARSVVAASVGLPRPRRRHRKRIAHSPPTLGLDAVIIISRGLPSFSLSAGYVFPPLFSIVTLFPSLRFFQATVTIFPSSSTFWRSRYLAHFFPPPPPPPPLLRLLSGVAGARENFSCVVQSASGGGRSVAARPPAGRQTGLPFVPLPFLFSLGRCMSKVKKVVQWKIAE